MRFELPPLLIQLQAQLVHKLIAVNLLAM